MVGGVDLHSTDPSLSRPVQGASRDLRSFWGASVWCPDHVMGVGQRFLWLELSANPVSFFCVGGRWLHDPSHSFGCGGCRAATAQGPPSLIGAWTLPLVGYVAATTYGNPGGFIFYPNIPICFIPSFCLWFYLYTPRLFLTICFWLSITYMELFLHFLPCLSPCCCWDTEALYVPLPMLAGEEPCMFFVFTIDRRTP